MKKKIFCSWVIEDITEITKIIGIDALTLDDIIDSEKFQVVSFDLTDTGKVVISGHSYKSGFCPYLENMDEDNVNTYYYILTKNKKNLLSVVNNWDMLTFYVKDVQVEPNQVLINGKKYDTHRTLKSGFYYDWGQRIDYTTYDYSIKVVTEVGTHTVSLYDLLSKNTDVYLVN